MNKRDDAIIKFTDKVESIMTMLQYVRNLLDTATCYSEAKTDG